MFGDEIYNAVYEALENGHPMNEILKALGEDAATAEKDFNASVEEKLDDARFDLIDEMANYVSLLTKKPVTKEEKDMLNKMLQDMEKKPTKTKEEKKKDNDDDEVIKAFVRLFG